MQIDTVMGWHDEYEKRGKESFTVRFSPGRPPRLMERDLKRLGFLLLKGSVANGYRTEIWTTKRIAEVIAREWRVGYHPDHIGRLMAKHGWTHQKPARRASRTAGCPSRLRQRIRLPPDPRGAQNVGTPGDHPGVPAPPPPGEGLRDLGGHRQSSEKMGRTLAFPSRGPISGAPTVAAFVRHLLRCADTPSSSVTTPGPSRRRG